MYIRLNRGERERERGFGDFQEIWARLCRLWGGFLESLGRLGRGFGSFSGAYGELSGCHVGPSWLHLGSSMVHLGPSWRHIGFWRSFWEVLASVGEAWGSFCRKKTILSDFKAKAKEKERKHSVRKSMCKTSFKFMRTPHKSL